MRGSPVASVTITPGAVLVANEDFISRFWQHVSIEELDGCWEWTGVKVTGPLKYGKFSVKTNGRWTMVQAHRVAYALVHGTWPPAHTDHTCCNPSCANPAHLDAVTRKQNMERMAERGRSRNQKKEHCPRGHAYDKVRKRVNGTTFRMCTACSWSVEKERRDRKRREQEGINSR